MSEDLKKQHLRTQGKYSNVNQKKRDKRMKISPGIKEPSGKRPNRYSNEGGEQNKSHTDEDVSPIKYEENSEYSFDQLEEPKQDIEIRKPGKHVLSNTHNGQSRIYFEPNFMNRAEAYEYYDRLESIVNWSSKDIVINNEKYPQPRLVAWFGPYPYSYSGATLEPAEMPRPVLEIKERVEQMLSTYGIDVAFNSVLLNLYRNNRDSVAWHSDDESTMGICPTIASVSLGEIRKFEMKRRYRYSEEESPEESQNYFVHLTHGSLIVMDGCMQDDWLHRVPKEYHDKNARINLTFRTVFSLENVPRKAHAREYLKTDAGNLNSSKTSSCEVSFNDDDFPPLSTDVPACSNVKRGIGELVSHSVSRNEEPNNSFWDTEKSIDETLDAENNMLDYKDSHESNFQTEEAINMMEENDSSLEMQSVENDVDDSKSSSNITHENVDNKRPVWNPNAKEFVPNFLPPSSEFNPVFLPPSSEFTPISNAYTSFSLEELLPYNVDIMDIKSLSNFSHCLKERIMEKMSECMKRVRDDLQFLCTIADGTQTEKNLKLITKRMIFVISDHLKKQQMPPNVPRSYDRSHTPHYGRQNYVDRGRQNHHPRRENSYRY